MFLFVFVFKLVLNSLRILRWFVKFDRFDLRMRGNDFVKVLYTFEVCVYRFLYFSIFMILRLFTIFMPFILFYTCSFVNHFSSYPFCEVAFHCSHMLGDHNSCSNWILLCLIFCLCWLYDSMKMIKAFSLILSTTTLGQIVNSPCECVIISIPFEPFCRCPCCFC